MNKRKYNTDPELLLKQGKAIMSSTDEARYHFKVFAVNMVLSGCSAAQIGTMAGVSKVAVTGWVKQQMSRDLKHCAPKGTKGVPQSLPKTNIRKSTQFFKPIQKKLAIKTGMVPLFPPI